MLIASSSKGHHQIFSTAPQMFLNRCKQNPNRPAFYTKEGSEWKSVLWKDYLELVRNISLGLVQLGVNPKDRVCIVSNTRIEWAATDVAIMSAKAVTVPVYASNTAEESAYIIDHCDAKIVFVEDRKQLEKILSIKAKIPKVQKIIYYKDPGAAFDSNVISFEALQQLGKKHSNPALFEKNISEVTAKDTFTICYTSGTTGVPKGVVIPFDALASVIEDIDVTLGKFIGPDDVTLSFLPLSHIFGRVESMMGYHFGWTTYYAESVEKILLNLAEVKPTVLVAVPRVFEKAYNRIRSTLDESTGTKKHLVDWALKAGETYFKKVWNRERPTLFETAQYLLAKQLVYKKVYERFGGKLRYCIAGGAPLPRQIGEFLRIVGISILEGYGLTETCAPVTLNTPYAIKFGSIGKPLPEVSLKIANDGEILVKSRKVFDEYFKSPEATAEVKTKDGWFHTGDIGEIDDEGFVKITDRKKDLIITSGGKNVAPQKIENMAKSYKHIAQFVIMGDRRNYLIALVVLDKEEVVKYAKANNILFSEYNELLKNAKIQALVQKMLDEINCNLASYETVKRFKILSQDFSIETGELTPSLKVRRRFCAQKYKEDIDSLYGSEVIV
jgi:long-chain acyl-CoA synthetase